MPERTFSADANLEHYRRQAKDLFKRARAAEPHAVERIRRVRADTDLDTSGLKLADVHRVIAVEHGFDDWPAFARELERTPARLTMAVWRAAENALVRADTTELDRLLVLHPQIRTQSPPPSTPGSLTPTYVGPDARTIIARNHHFADQAALEAFRRAMRDEHGSTRTFEAAVDAVVRGQLSVLRALLRETPGLVRLRSPRGHGATLLHYVGANGVEYFRQRSPKNAAAVARILLTAGAEVDAEADLYGRSTTLQLAATSIAPALSGSLTPLLDVLVEAGARLVSRAGRSFVNDCLANGRLRAAEHLAARGAPVDLEGACGLGLLPRVAAFVAPDGSLREGATSTQLIDGLSWACEYGRAAVVALLLERGLDVRSQLRPHRQTGLHWAAFGAHVETVRVLLRHHAPIDPIDETYSNTPLRWALFRWKTHPSARAHSRRYYQTVALLVGAGAHVEPAWLEDDRVKKDPRMSAALRVRSAHPSLVAKKGGGVL